MSFFKNIYNSVKDFFSNLVGGKKGNTPVITPPTETPVEIPETDTPIEVEPPKENTDEGQETKPEGELSDDELIMLIVENITGVFEGSKLWENVTGNFDGQGLSAGVLQWNYGQGSLQSKILRPYIARHGSIDALKIFPSGYSIDKSANMSTSQGISFAKNMQSGTKVTSTWLAAWRKFLSKPEVIQLQIEACRSVLSNAKSLAHAWNMSSRVSYIWFFDVITQNGSLKGISKPAYDINEAKRVINLVDSNCKAVWKTVDLNSLPPEQVILLIASQRRASKSISKYFNDVFSRKGTIALGKGFVHGSKFDFTQHYK